MSKFDVVVIGGGIAGMAASIHLARAGLHVLCIEAEIAEADLIGESLDWSAPDLLAGLGLPMQRLLDEDIATYKRHVILQLSSGAEQHYVPGEWLGKPPFNVELSTIHVDRRLLHRAIRVIFSESGAKSLIARVTRIEVDGDRITAVHCSDGSCIEARWFVDASGSNASLFPRLFNLPFTEYGPRKVAMWDYFETSKPAEGTTIYADSAPMGYMEWIWKIPIHPDTVSVGYVTTGDAVREKRQNAESLGEIFNRQLNLFPGLSEISANQSIAALRTTSFRCRVCKNIAGPNWIAIGESSTMVDPMTSNGVTAALRQAAESAALIARYRSSPRLPRLAARVYSWRVDSVARFFNCGIEKIVYDWPVRNRIGIARAGDVYTILAWLMNLVYSRMRPEGVVKTMLYAASVASLRGAFNVFYWFCKKTAPSRPVGAAA